MSDQEEYEVESIREARVEAPSQSKKAKLVWKYLVRWKGYKAEDDTWEPTDSFVGSEDLVKTFWERAQTNGRDINDMSLFKVGETFHPIGPPKRPKRKSMNDASTSGLTQSSPKVPAAQGTSRTSEKRRRISPDPLDLPPKQRKRWRNDTTEHSQNTQQPTPSRDRGNISTSRPPRSHTRGEKSGKTTPVHARRKSTKAASPEVIPDSDEEMNLSPSLMNYLRSDPSFKSSVSVEHPDPMITNEHPAVDKANQSPTDGPSCETMPAHRAREANPLVKMMDYSGLEDVSDAISTRRQAVGHQIAIPSSSKGPSPNKRAKPGPGRSSSGLLKPQKNTSSLLTFEKGSLKTIKGNYSNDKAIEESNGLLDHTENSSPAPLTQGDNNVTEIPLSGEQLLTMAGLNPNETEILSDFEDENVDNVKMASNSKPQSSSAMETSEAKDDSFNNASLTVAKNNLFPPTASSGTPPTFNDAWKRSTIFGPLTLGSENTYPSDQLKTPPLLLNLDASVSIPIHLSELSNSSIQLSSKMGLKGTPGKFYSTETALVLLGTVRAGGTSAIATVDETATGEEKTHFEHFSSRLEAGDLFVAVIGIQILVFCSAGNTLLSRRLNAPSSLLKDPSKVLVSEVEVENYSGYADAAANADDRRWSQIIAAK